MASSILLVEDDLYLSQGLTELLQKSGYVPCQARNLSQARQSVYSRNFDLLHPGCDTGHGRGRHFLLPGAPGKGVRRAHSLPHRPG